MKIFLSLIFLGMSVFNAASAFENTIRYEEDCFDLEAGIVIPRDPVIGACLPEIGDFWFTYSPAGLGTYTVVSQNRCIMSMPMCEEGAKIAHSAKAYSEVNFTDLSSLEFTSDLVDIDFASVTAILHTLEGHYYKLGFIEEVPCNPTPAGDTCVKFQWEQLSDSNSPDPNPNGCEAVVYSNTDKKITFDKLAMELYSPFTDEPNGQFALFTGADMSLTMLAGFGDFKYKGGNPTYTGQTLIGANNCYPTYSTQGKTVRFPKIKVPLVSILPDGNTADGPMTCYSAMLKLSTTQAKANIFKLIEINEIPCE
ncbi:MAG: hypothetical protein HC877_01435 [Thioploca sp.]|nr:hypothetical protein [Thioploca sp.]